MSISGNTGTIHALTLGAVPAMREVDQPGDDAASRLNLEAKVDVGQLDIGIGPGAFQRLLLPSGRHGHNEGAQQYGLRQILPGSAVGIGRADASVGAGDALTRDGRIAATLDHENDERGLSPWC